jgi:predicted XRE-type DNA-binding protein
MSCAAGHAGEIEIAMPAKQVANPSKRADNTRENLRALFGANFRQARLKAKLTQAAVEELTGIRQHYVSEIEYGLHNLTLDTMTTLAQAVGTDVRALLRRPPKKR